MTLLIGVKTSRKLFLGTLSNYLEVIESLNQPQALLSCLQDWSRLSPMGKTGPFYQQG